MKVTDLQFSFDKGMYRMLVLKKMQVIKRDQDFLGVVDGGEGTGKSTFTAQCAAIVDPTFRGDSALERTCFTPEEFTEQIMKAKKYQAVVLDEARAALNSRQSMTKVSRTLTSMLAEVRQKNLFLFVVLPSIYDLDKYVALWRTKCLMHLYLEGGRQGQFKVWTRKQIKDLFFYGKKTFSYRKPRCKIIGRFGKYQVLPQAEYLGKKREAFLRFADYKGKEIDPKIRNELVMEAYNRAKTLNLPFNNILLALNVPKSTFFYNLSKENEVKSKTLKERDSGIEIPP